MTELSHGTAMYLFSPRCLPRSTAIFRPIIRRLPLLKQRQQRQEQQRQEQLRQEQRLREQQRQEQRRERPERQQHRVEKAPVPGVREELSGPGMKTKYRCMLESL